MSAERGEGGVMRKTVPTCRSHTAEGKEQDDYEVRVSHHAGEFPEVRAEFLLSTRHTGTPPKKRKGTVIN